MIEIVSLLVKFGPAGLQVVIMYFMLKFFGDRQDKIVDAHERASSVVAAAIDKNTEAVNMLLRRGIE